MLVYKKQILLLPMYKTVNIFETVIIFWSGFFEQNNKTNLTDLKLLNNSVCFDLKYLV